MRPQLVPAAMAVALFTAITLLYVGGTTLVDQLLFQNKAEGSLVKDASGNVVGSRLIGQSFVAPQYFHPRPSAVSYAPGPAPAAGTNYGPTNDTLLQNVADAVKAYRDENGLSADVAVPVDAVTSSGSGLDPDITVANAKLQAPRVAANATSSSPSSSISSVRTPTIACSPCWANRL